MQDEFDFISNLKQHFNLEAIGDDCAVFPKDDNEDYLITSDMLVEDVDFRRSWFRPRLLGSKAAAVSISDIHAMGGVPRFSMLSLALPKDMWRKEFLDPFYEGFLSMTRQFGGLLVGGDVSKTETKIVIDSTLIGTVAKGNAVLRSGASSGDLIFVTGSLGGAAGGLRLLEAGAIPAFSLEEDSNIEDVGLNSWQRMLISKQLNPTPVSKTPIGIASAMIDISDGLSGDLRHICEASNVGARIIAEDIPIDSQLGGLNLPFEETLKMALNGGEDFELLFTVNPKKKSIALGTGSTLIGEITQDTDNIELILGGKPFPLEPNSHKHF